MSYGFLRHVLRDQDLDSKIPPIESVPVVSEFPKVFPNDLSYLYSSKQKINNGIDLLPDTNPILIPL